MYWDPNRFLIIAILRLVSRRRAEQQKAKAMFLEVRSWRSCLSWRVLAGRDRPGRGAGTGGGAMA